MSESNHSSNLLIDNLLNDYWSGFYRDQISDCLEISDKLISLSENDLQIFQFSELKARIYLKLGRLLDAKQLFEGFSFYSSLKIFIDFLLGEDPANLVKLYASDYQSKTYKSFTLSLTKVYWGNKYTEAIDGYEDSDDLILSSFESLIADGNYDLAIIIMVKSLEISLQEVQFSKNILESAIREQVIYLKDLASLAKYDSTRAKVFLLESTVGLEREVATDAEILFGKDKNELGLAEVYFHYSHNYGENDYLDKALAMHKKVGCLTGLNLVYSIKASYLLSEGKISDAEDMVMLGKANSYQLTTFDKLNNEIQYLSLLSILGRHQEVYNISSAIIRTVNAPFFKAQARQILVGTKLKNQADSIDDLREQIALVCKEFLSIKSFHHLLHAQDIELQVLISSQDLEVVEAKVDEIIKLSTKLNLPEEKANKYLDLAYATITISTRKRDLDEEKFNKAINYFHSALEIYQEHNNLFGQANIYQAMGDLLSNVGKFEEALDAFVNAKKIFLRLGSKLQCAVTDTLIGVMVLSPGFLNRSTFVLAYDHLSSSLNYFNEEDILDLIWKLYFYLAELCSKYSQIAEKDVQKHIDEAKEMFLRMLNAIEVYEQNNESHQATALSMTNVTISTACRKARDFFVKLGDDNTAQKFLR